MNIAQLFLRGIVSAGGEGVRLKACVHKRDGTDVSRQLSVLTGSAPTPRHRIFLTET